METHNATIITSDELLGPWITSLQATLLCKYGNIAVKLERKIRNHFNDFMIQWANPKSNWLFLIECRQCGGAAFGYWGRWDENHLEDADGGRNPAMLAILVLCEFVKGDTPISSNAAFELAQVPVSG